MKNPINTSIKLKFILIIILASITPLYIVTYVTLSTVENSLKNRILEQLDSIVLERANAIEILAHLRIQGVQAISVMLIVQEYMNYFDKKLDESINNSELENTLTTDLEKALLKLQDLTGGNVGFFDYKFIDANGRVYYSANKSLIGGDFSENSRFKRAILGESFLEYDFDKTNDLPMTVVTVPLRYDSEKKIGALIVTIGTSITESITNNYKGLGDTGEMLLIDNDGKIITKSRFIEDRDFVKSSSVAVKNCAQNTSTSEIIQDYRGVSVLASSYCFSQGSTLVGKINTAEAFAPVENLRNTVYAIIILSTILVGIISFILARSITRPLVRLMTSTKCVAKGDFDAIKLPSGRDGDEIKRLEKDVFSMAQQLRNTFSSMQENAELRIETETLRKTNDERIEFASIAGHELRTPLTIIDLNIQILLEKKDNLDKKQVERLTKIRTHTTNMMTLIGDLLDATRFELNQIALNKENVDIRKHLENLIESLSPLLLQKKISHVLKLEGTWIMYCDPLRISQVVSNLVKNSLDFVPEGGKITLSAQQMDNSDTMFTVEDTGVGIPPEKANDLFRKFYHIDTATTRRHGGTGLGLAICKGLVEAHGGKIWFDKNYKNGARFQFTLPAKH